MKIAAVVIDGDDLRASICSHLGFSVSDRLLNISRAASIAKMANSSGIIAICSLVSPLARMRNEAKKIIGKNNFIEIFIDTPLAICMERDSKELYLKAQKGLITNLSGYNDTYEKPLNPAIIIENTHQTPRDGAQKILNYLYLEYPSLLAQGNIIP